MKKLLIALALACAAILPARADDFVFARGNISVIARTGKACYPEVVKLMSDEAKKMDWRAADEVFEGRQIKACWTRYEDNVVIIDEEGDIGMVPQIEFRKLKDV